MQIYSSPQECCGCSACKHICPTQAVTMQSDSEGFLYPVTDNAKCINCGACKKVCPVSGKHSQNHARKAFAVKHKDYDTRITSRSGGVFIAISDYVLKRNGTVYGAGFSDDLSVCHLRTETAKERNRLKGTKYVQSDVADTFSKVKADLKNGMYVLYSGTPCQIAGLMNYLKNTDTEKLITCDIICHGVPSPQIYADYLKYCEKKYGGKVTKFDFRDKTFGWRSQKEAIWVDDKKYNTNEYAYLFSGLDVYRPACYECKFANIDRPADFTLGDFWGIDVLVKGFSDNKGVSLLFLNTDKAEAVFDGITNDIDYEPTVIDKVIPFNPNLYRPTAVPKDREKFWKNYHKKGFNYVLKKNYNKIFRKRVVQKFNEKKDNIIKKFK